MVEGISGTVTLPCSQYALIWDAARHTALERFNSTVTVLSVPVFAFPRSPQRSVAPLTGELGRGLPGRAVLCPITWLSEGSA